MGLFFLGKGRGSYDFPNVTPVLPIIIIIITIPIICLFSWCGLLPIHLEQAAAWRPPQL